MTSPATDALVAVVIEDDPDARELTRLVLTQSGFSVVVAADGPAGIEAVREHNPVLTTLDVQMPGPNGFSVAKELREFSLTYLIMITSMASELDVIQGFEAGADDYLVKPFRPRELRARADSMLRRPRARAGVPGATETSWAAALAAELGANPLAPLPGLSPAAEPVAPMPTAVPAPAPTVVPDTMPVPVVVPAAVLAPEPVLVPAAAAAAPTPATPSAPTHLRQPTVGTAPLETPTGLLTFAGVSLDSLSGHATYHGRPLDLTTSELDLLSTLMRTGRRVRSKADLVLALRGHSHGASHFVNEADKRAVDAHVIGLRGKLGDQGETPKVIETVRGVGYRMVGIG